MSKIIEKFLRHFKIMKFINRYRAIHNWNKVKEHRIYKRVYLGRLKKYYLFSDRDMRFITQRLK